MAHLACGAGYRVDWEAWAAVGTVLAAIATVAAIWVALSASRREHDRTIQLRDAEWERQDRTRRGRVAVLAHAFARELLQAAVSLMSNFNALNAVMRRPGTQGPALAMSMLTQPTSIHTHLVMMERLAGDLDGFTDLQATGILNAISAWKNVTTPIPTSMKGVETAMQIQLVAQRMSDIELTLELFHDLQALLKESASELGFVDERTMEEVRDDATTRRNARIATFGIMHDMRRAPEPGVDASPSSPTD